ncbi:olfactory receptor 2D3-like [Spea bombifrons]|uniref:olfactory receptor 2D3-like n=1 Tax=Spea bombifrons TaxID=233779 RepID=UPI00234A78C8|nr:olfactory receptor 2D3-like [Spea bombifrons]
MSNFTNEDGFILNAFSSKMVLHALYFVLFLIIYLVTILGNMLIIFVSSVDHHLQTPMYFLLRNLSFMDICYTSTTLPQILTSLHLKYPAISFAACIAQQYFFLTLAASESSLLATMAYDRYVAICFPLRYVTIMNKEACLKMTVTTWLIGCIYGVVHTANTFRLPFCGSKILNHFFCDIPPLLKISCIDTYFNEVTIFVVGGFLMLGCFLLILGSYMSILSSIFNIPKGFGREKAFSTCVSHLIVVLLFYGSGSFMYFRPKSNHLADKEWLLSIFYTSITPLLNPLIYSLRNKDIQEALLKQLKLRVMLRYS